ncbi:hypothetical protein [Chryseobacterium lathyri]|uniref:hypothetical protein n=1 Tax=Chryseobacterium lathyri TaxID=395933 RepID=UPI0027869410|nr:hypothetical protein [Chryseobacterium lathyri]MDQ0065922.1 hypothetical protein [Chryseobacterium lathyri]
MNVQLFQKIWKDSVWSKIISVIILAVVTFIYNALVAKDKNETILESLSQVLYFKVELWIFIVICLSVCLVLYFTKRQFKYDNETLELDRKLFNQISNGEGILELILEIKGNGFSSHPVKMERIETMIDLLEESKKPNFEFLNPQLDALKCKILDELSNLDSTLSNYVFGANLHGWVSIPSEWEYGQSERFNKAKSEIRKQEDIFTEVYQKFITEGRKILKV